MELGPHGAATGSAVAAGATESAAGTAAATITDNSGSLSLHSIECFLQNLEVAAIASLFSCRFDPFFLESIFRRPIRLVKHAEDAGERKRGEFVCSELVGDVVAEFVLGCVVPLFLLNDFEAAALLRIGRVEDVREKFDAFAQTFDDTEALVVHRAFDQLNHVRYLRGVRARDECCATGD